MKDEQYVTRWLELCDRAESACADPRISADAYGRAVDDQIVAMRACRADGWTIEELDAHSRRAAQRGDDGRGAAGVLGHD